MMKKNKILSKQVMWLVVTEVQSESFRLVTEHCHYNAHYVTLYYVSAVIFLIVECGIARFLCTMHAYEVQESISPLDYLCTKFRFCGDFHC